MAITKTKIVFTVLIELFIIFLQLGKARNLGPVDTGIGCFVCSSRNGSNPACEDPFHPGYMNDSYKDRCKVPKRNHVGEFPAHFCIKVIGKSYETNEKIVVRRCSIYTMENQCGNFLFQNDLMRGCILTCELDGCNNSNPTHSSVHLILASILFSSFFLFKSFFHEVGWTHQFKLR